MQEQRAPIEVLVNGEPRRIAGDATVADLVAALELGNRRIAVEVNEELVPRGEMADYELAAGDRVEVVRAIGGG
ncbi:sulfur carrier protein ThiS [Arhodomonas sp. SL1]|uniref:sulfur carrier protein ThiS n=1 Tax=Arhodomonas sp. SL1 TaxID=3425691 RepID=UPI003F88048E